MSRFVFDCDFQRFAILIEEISLWCKWISKADFNHFIFRDSSYVCWKELLARLSFYSTIKFLAKLFLVLAINSCIYSNRIYPQLRFVYFSSVYVEETKLSGSDIDIGMKLVLEQFSQIVELFGSHHTTHELMLSFFIKSFVPLIKGESMSSWIKWWGPISFAICEHCFGFG